MLSRRPAKPAPLWKRKRKLHNEPGFDYRSHFWNESLLFRRCVQHRRLYLLPHHQKRAVVRRYGQPIADHLQRVAVITECYVLGSQGFVEFAEIRVLLQAVLERSNRFGVELAPPID